jgi:hypothetical protein
MLPMMLAGMGAGLLKSQLVDRPQADRERQLAATTASLSPWTGLTPSMPSEANPLGSVMQGGLAGAQLGQGMQKQAQDQEMLDMYKQQQQQKQQQDNQPGTLIPKMGMPKNAWFSMGNGQILS